MSLRQRIFAAALHRGSRRYERLVDEDKRALFGSLEGRVLEIGPGPGTNLRFFRPEVRYVGLEPNPHMHRYLREEAAKLGREVEVLQGGAEEIPLPDASVDAVVSSLVLCSVDDPARSLAEVRRVLRPGGRFVFIEHVAAPAGTALRRMQRLARPVSVHMADGCHPDRETGRAIEAAGFERAELRERRLPLWIYGPHLFGSALR